MRTFTSTISILITLSTAACAVDKTSNDQADELSLGGDFPDPGPMLRTITPAAGPPGTSVTITGTGLNDLACTGGRQISSSWLAYAGVSVACTYNANGTITAKVPSTATTSAPFQLLSWVNACAPLGTCIQQQVVSSTAVFSNQVTIAWTNRTRYPITKVTNDNVPWFVFQNPLQPNNSNTQPTAGLPVPLDDASFQPTSTHRIWFTMTLPSVGDVVEFNDVTLGFATTPLEARFTAAELLTIFATAQSNGNRCYRFNNPSHYIDVCTTPSGVGTGSRDGQLLGTVSDSPAWDAHLDDVPFTIGGHAGHLALYARVLYLDNELYGWVD